MAHESTTEHHALSAAEDQANELQGSPRNFLRVIGGLLPPGASAIAIARAQGAMTMRMAIPVPHGWSPPDIFSKEDIEAVLWLMDENVPAVDALREAYNSLRLAQRDHVPEPEDAQPDPATAGITLQIAVLADTAKDLAERFAEDPSIDRASGGAVPILLQQIGMLADRASIRLGGGSLRDADDPMASWMGAPRA